MGLFEGSLMEQEVDDDHIVLVYRFLYNDRLCFANKHETWGYERAFCFPQDGSAFQAALEWDGTGDPPGPWIKEVGTDRYGPGSKAHADE